MLQALPLPFLTPSGPRVRGNRVTGGAIEGRDLPGQFASLLKRGQGITYQAWSPPLSSLIPPLLHPYPKPQPHSHLFRPLPSLCSFFLCLCTCYSLPLTCLSLPSPPTKTLTSLNTQVRASPCWNLPWIFQAGLNAPALCFHSPCGNFHEP